MTRHIFCAVDISLWLKCSGHTLYKATVMQIYILQGSDKKGTINFLRICCMTGPISETSDKPKIFPKMSSE